MNKDMRAALATLTLALPVAALLQAPAAAQPPAPPAAPAPAPAPAVKHRMIVLSDIEADPDDTQTFIRLFVYANQIDLEGLVATTSTFLRERVYPESIRRVIAAYAKVQPNLLRHEGGYPTAAALQALVLSGQPGYGMAAVGAGKDTPGSNRIIQALERPDPRPLWVSAWGGPNTLAQALFRIRETRTPAEADRLIAKLRVYTISDQDDSGPWIRKNFPNLFYIVSPGGYGPAVWSAITRPADGLDNRTISNDWIRDHIQQQHGPLGAIYPDVAYGMEGDTPSWLNLILNGLSDPEHPDWGGWGGRYVLTQLTEAQRVPNGFSGGVPFAPETRPIWTNSPDTIKPYQPADYGRPVVPGKDSITDPRATIWRWRDDMQNDFAARIAWTTEPYAKANHPPVVRLAHPDRLTVHSGERFVLDSTGTTDPDGDSLSYLWFNYPEAGTLKEPIAGGGSENLYRRSFTAPKVTKPETAHFILRVTDKGSPPITRYRRVIVTILP